MSIIVQCGHELTYSEALMNMLNERGLNKPFQSAKNGLSATEVTIALDKIHKKSSNLIDNKLAESVAIDFLLTNLEVDNWGWNNSKNLTSLYYWEWLEPDCKFVLVFDHPREVLKYAVKNDLSQVVLDKMIEDWVVFQQDLLTFYINNKNRCVLLEGTAALNDIKHTEKCIHSIAPDLFVQNKEAISSNSSLKHKSTANNIDKSKQKEYLNNKLLDELLNKYPKLIQVFNDLREVSDINSSDELLTDIILGREDVYSIIKSLQNVDDNNQKDIINSLNLKLSEKERKIEKLTLLLKDNERFSKKQSDDIKNLEYKSKNNSDKLKLQSTHSEPSHNNNSEMILLKKENRIILKQLHLVQKELEYYFSLKESRNIDKNQRSKEVQTVEEVQTPTPKEATIVKTPKAIPFGVEQRIKLELPYRVGASIIENSKTKRGILTLPKAIAMEYIDYNNSITSLNNLPSIEEYGDFDKAEKIKQHLSYQIGEIVAESIKEPKKIITAPIRIGNRVLSFKKARFIKEKK